MAYSGDYAVPEQIRQFVVYFYRHIRYRPTWVYTKIGQGYHQNCCIMKRIMPLSEWPN